MKHTIEELQFADTVRTLAYQLRNAAQVGAVDRELESDLFAAARATWQAQHPVEEFILPALQELQKFAGVIKSLA